MALEQDYEVQEVLGEGAFGKVYKARFRKNGDIVAVKQIKLGAKSWEDAMKATELQVLKVIRHPYIIRLRELIRSMADGSLYYIFDFIGGDLFRLLKNFREGMEELRAAELTRQLLAGLAFMHQHGFFHRDVKPENVLYDAPSGTIRLADFGEARALRARPPFTDYVGTRWYRAPECLLRDRAYSSPVDVWAAGLVFAELMRGSAVFCGTSSIDQLYKIFTVLGPPPSDWQDYARLAETARFRAPHTPGCGLSRVVQRASPQAQAVLAELVALNPRRRPQARRCLEHSYFVQLAPPDTERSEGGARSRASSARGSRLEEPHEPDSPAAFAIDAPGSRRGEATRPGSAAPPHESQEATEVAPAHVASDGDVGAAPATGSKAASGAATPATGMAPSLDLDLDAELDKILGGTASPKKASRPQEGGGVAAAGAAAAQGNNGLRGAERHQSLTDTAAGLGASMTLSAFSFTPQVRSQQAGAYGSKAVAAKGAVPQSPGASVDALLDSLCADLGVTTHEETIPEEPGSDVGEPASNLGLTALCADLGMSSGQGDGGKVPAAASQRRAGSSGADARGRLVKEVAHEPMTVRDVDFDEDSEKEVARAQEQRPTQGRSKPEALSYDDSSGSDGAGEAGKGTRRQQRCMGLLPGQGTSAVDAPQESTEKRGSLGLGAGRGSFVSTLSSTGGYGAAAAALAASRVPGGRPAQAPENDAHAWPPEEAAELRKAVKRVRKSMGSGLAAGEKEELWAKVSAELGGRRSPRSCKHQYARDYRAHKSAGGHGAAAPESPTG